MNDISFDVYDVYTSVQRYRNRNAKRVAIAVHIIW